MARISNNCCCASFCRSWFTCSGLKSRARATKNESMRKRVLYGVTFGLCSIFCFYIGALHWAKKQNADGINEDFDGLFEEIDFDKSLIYNGFNSLFDVDSAYNKCIYPNYEKATPFNLSVFLKYYDDFVDYCGPILEA